MPETLHILNGDGTAGGFFQSGLEGDTLIWREMLCEGPVSESRNIELFWEERARFLGQFDPVNGQDLFYSEVYSEIAKLPSYHNYQKIILWFEFDLFCQINLIFILSWLYTNDAHEQVEIFLVCPKDHPEIEHFRGMGQLSPSQIAKLFESRIQLTEQALAMGHRTWSAYQSDNPLEIQDLKSKEFGVLDCLAEAILMHLQRFPFLSDGLNRIEKRLLISLKNHPLSTGELFMEFWSTETKFGFGDLQIMHYLDILHPELLTFSNEKYLLTPTGHSCLNGLMDWSTIKKTERSIGGYHCQSTPEYRFDESTMKLIHIVK